VKFRVTDERGWVREFEAEMPAALADGVRRAWDDRIAESRIAKPDVAGTVHGVHPAFAFKARMAWIEIWLEARMASATPTSDVRSWRAQADLWRHQARVDLGGDERLSPLRLHVWAPGDPGTTSVWSTLCRRTGSGAWGCSPSAPHVARVVDDTRAVELYEGAAAMCEHARNLDALAGHVGDEVRKALHPRPRLVASAADDHHEYRARVDGRGAAAELTQADALERVRGWLTDAAEDSIAGGHGVPVGLSGQVDRRKPGGGAWMPWRTLRIRQEPGEETWSIVRADR
jgi:hypothetical protein